MAPAPDTNDTKHRTSMATSADTNDRLTYYESKYSTKKKL